MKEAEFSANLNNTNERNQKMISLLRAQGETAGKKKKKEEYDHSDSFPQRILTICKQC